MKMTVLLRLTTPGMGKMTLVFLLLLPVSLTGQHIVDTSKRDTICGNFSVRLSSVSYRNGEYENSQFPFLILKEGRDSTFFVFADTTLRNNTFNWNYALATYLPSMGIYPLQPEEILDSTTFSTILRLQTDFESGAIVTPIETLIEGCFLCLQLTTLPISIIDENNRYLYGITPNKVYVVLRSIDNNR